MRISFTVWCKDDRAIGRTLKRLKEIRRVGDEIIVADMSSRDQQVVQILANEAETAVSLPPDSKIGEARNASISLAKGDIVVSMDADTWVPGNVVAELEKAFADPRVMAAACNVSVYPWMENGRDKAFVRILNLRFRLSFLLGRPYSRGEFQAFRNRDVRYNTNLYSGEDGEIMERHAGQAVYLNNLTVYESPKRYRMRGHIGTFLMWSRSWLILKIFKRSLSYRTIPKD